MKKNRALVVVALAAGAAVAVWAAVRPAGGAARAPADWMQQSAVALNRMTVAPAPGAARTGVAAGPTAGTTGATNWALEGERLRVQRRFSEAADAFRRAVDANPADADSWADLADCEAAAAGRDLSRGKQAILRALEIDPRHRKALWLRASLELQEQRYGAAAATWRELSALVAPGSADARVIAANIEEAESLARPGRPGAGQGG